MERVFSTAQHKPLRSKHFWRILQHFQLVGNEIKHNKCTLLFSISPQQWLVIIQHVGNSHFNSTIQQLSFYTFIEILQFYQLVLTLFSFVHLAFHWWTPPSLIIIFLVFFVVQVLHFCIDPVISPEVDRIWNLRQLRSWSYQLEELWTLTWLETVRWVISNHCIQFWAFCL